mmetsp:Transcript_1448/g.3393  ORF Transcript_1448/g.3393 Transcript_1448/m.3393 type:complete len:282 (-) Transcript_1448:807-1652(-)
MRSGIMERICSCSHRPRGAVACGVTCVQKIAPSFWSVARLAAAGSRSDLRRGPLLWLLLVAPRQRLARLVLGVPLRRGHRRLQRHGADRRHHSRRHTDVPSDRGADGRRCFHSPAPGGRRQQERLARLPIGRAALLVRVFYCSNVGARSCARGGAAAIPDCERGLGATSAASEHRGARLYDRPKDELPVCPSLAVRPVAPRCLLELGLVLHTGVRPLQLPLRPPVRRARLVVFRGEILDVAVHVGVSQQKLVPVQRGIRRRFTPVHGEFLLGARDQPAFVL